jgi:ribose-phosphate pyrophosphokinase
MMTTFAMASPAVRRLFERLDFAPEPKDASLFRILEYWKGKRGGRIAPAPREIMISDLGEDAAAAFILQFDDRTRTPTLAFSGAAFEAFIGPCDPSAAIMAEAPQRRNIARFRRHLELVRARAEPVLVEFVSQTAHDSRRRVEIFIAPLSSDGKNIDGIYGGLAFQRTHIASTRLAHAPQTWTVEHMPLLFALKSAAHLGERIAHCLGQTLQDHEERDFEDGEHKTRPLIDVRDKKAHVIAGLHGDNNQSVNDRLCRLLFFVGALKDSGAAHVTVTAPYLCYARKDRQTQPHDPITTRYIGQLFEALGIDRLITMEVHNLVAFQNAFRCNTTHLDAYSTFGRYIATAVGDSPIAVVSPDIGGAKRAEHFRQSLEKLLGRPVSKGLADKQRSMGQMYLAALS